MFSTDMMWSFSDEMQKTAISKMYLAKRVGHAAEEVAKIPSSSTRNVAAKNLKERITRMSGGAAEHADSAGQSARHAAREGNYAAAAAKDTRSVNKAEQSKLLKGYADSPHSASLDVATNREAPGHAMQNIVRNRSVGKPSKKAVSAANTRTRAVEGGYGGTYGIRSPKPKPAAPTSAPSGGIAAGARQAFGRLRGAFGKKPAPALA